MYMQVHNIMCVAASAYFIIAWDCQKRGKVNSKEPLTLLNDLFPELLLDVESIQEIKYHTF